MRRIPVLLVLVVVTLARAQSSASFHLNESTFNAGGDPVNGVSAASASFHVTLDAIGDAVVSETSASPSYHAASGFVGDHRPPGEVAGVLFVDKTTYVWSPDPSVGEYEVYRDTLGALPAGGFGVCYAVGVGVEAAVDSASPSSGQGWFYLVTARNNLGEEGTKGFKTGGVERANAAPCP